MRLIQPIRGIIQKSDRLLGVINIALKQGQTYDHSLDDARLFVWIEEFQNWLCIGFTWQEAERVANALLKSRPTPDIAVSEFRIPQIHSEGE